MPTFGVAAAPQALLLFGTFRPNEITELDTINGAPAGENHTQ